jgi:hypothetical protein
MTPLQPETPNSVESPKSGTQIFWVTPLAACSVRLKSAAQLTATSSKKLLLSGLRTVARWEPGAVKFDVPGWQNS